MSNETPTPSPYRLPRTVVPSHYEIALAPDLETFRFEGGVAIDVTVEVPVAEVVLNGIELEIHSAIIRDVSGREQQGDVSCDAELERVTVTFPTEVAAGAATLTIAFTGTINDELRGFYRSTFTDADGRDRVIATTQFESTDARRAFPCWDEPDFKATFGVQLLVPEGLLGLSNGAAVDERPTEGGTWVTFEKTMKMSTYLVAFIVGPLVATDPIDVDGVPLRVACVPGREHLTGFALEIGAHALRFLAGYFDIPYPAGKLDLVALPDFAFGAMENLACVTFRETALLVDAERASRLELQRVADVVAHEIAHMWFGDLVTMKWWNGIWLNEAFATFMEVATVDDFRPSWERWVSFSTERGAALLTDGLASTRPIEYEVVSPEDAEGMFDVLTYQKGGAVLRMLETYLGPTRFRDGIRLYLRRHLYANTETTDLWDAIEEATGEPVRAIMDSWILQGGHPLVTAEQGDGSVALTQRRFRYIPDPSDTEVQWQVPVLIRRLDSGEHSRMLLNGPSATVAFDGGPAVVNAGGWGVFRTRYSPSMFSQLIASLRDLTAIERFNLVSDTWAMALGGQADLVEFLDLVALLGGERNSSVWEAAIGGFDLVHREAGTSRRPAVSAFVRGLLEGPFGTVGWTAPSDALEDDDTAKLRAILVEALGTLGDDEAVISHALSLHESGLAGVAPDLASPVVSIVAWNGGPLEYELFWDRIRTATTPQDEVRYLFRLPLFRDASLLERTLDATLTEIRSQNGSFVISACLGNRWAGRDAWRWLVEHWDDVLKRIPDNSHGRLLDGIVRLTDPALVEEVPAWLAEHPVPSARKQVAQLLERQRVYAAFGARQQAVLAARFT